MLASVVDDRSGVCYQEYHYVLGEDAMTALRFLYNAMAPKPQSDIPFGCIPKILLLDNGPVAKSKLFRRVMTHLGIVQRTVFAFPSKRPKAFPAWTRAVSFEWYDIFLNEATFYVTVAP
ncbi:hypothetical protein [Pseudomonas savastanoi]|uniref:hypothetical protein n=1 Tax=Pseudomonas savastanoi TaxID=29438 RepID=UPI000BA421AB|nr:hypothetical protein [Pseudomonas savastanoi]PAB24618.1 hypothetical protein CCZ00_27365 [Pseudomonas savastanoi pv. fraxini]